MVCREAAGLEHDMAKATERWFGGLLHFLKIRANETKIGQKSVFTIEILKRFVEFVLHKHLLLLSK